MDSERPIRPRQGRGLIVVVILAVVFFTLVGLIILRSGRQERPSVSRSETLTVIPMRVRIRTEPHAGAPEVTTATTGERLSLLEDRGAWVRVRNSEGLTGWAERANLERTVEQQRRAKRIASIRQLPPLEGVATTSTPLYAGPGIFYPMVGQLSKGSDVTVHTREHDFFAIAHGNSIAYADVAAIDITAPVAHQLDVSTPADDSTILEPEPELPPPAVAETREPPPLAPAPPPEPMREPVRTPQMASGRVYTSVPPGGTQPEEISRVVPNYPPQARRAGVQGAVVVRGIVRKNGRIDDVEVIKDLPFGLGDEARRAVSRWRFRPATYRGEPIDVYYTVTVNFRLR